MKKFTLTVSMLLWSLLANAYAETEKVQKYSGNSKLTVDNINKTVKVLRDPSIASENLQARVGKLSGKARSEIDDLTRALSVDQQDPEPTTGNDLNDPTKMSGSFRATMNKMTIRQTNAITTTGTPAQLPEISLAAIVYGNPKEYYAMLHVNEGTVLIKEGDQATFIDNNKIVELKVQQITKHDVRIAVNHSNQLIVLR